jgi:hypothetical protein
MPFQNEGAAALKDGLPDGCSNQELLSERIFALLYAPLVGFRQNNAILTKRSGKAAQESYLRQPPYRL